ncbi:MAG: hypothetical protein VYD83_03625, partial [SAR324 cluster bacterium]|nr:hypothetical protein [SAR324 cluster bacterium]
PRTIFNGYFFSESFGGNLCSRHACQCNSLIGSVSVEIVEKNHLYASCSFDYKTSFHVYFFYDLSAFVQSN